MMSTPKLPHSTSADRSTKVMGLGLNGQLLGALRNARFTRTLRLKALTTSRLRHGPRVHRTATSRETLYCVQLGAKKYRSFPRRYRSCTFG